MIQQRPVKHPGTRIFGIAVLSLGLLRLPLPQVDYHEIRHHHGPGQVCAHHDHLLRWHPDAGDDEAVAVLHWHWFVPPAGQARPDSGPAAAVGAVLHAHADGLEPDSIGDLILRADGGVRLIARPVSVASLLEPHLAVCLSCRGSPPPEPLDASLFTQPGWPTQPPLVLLARWNC